jgi:hypothetical protein
MGSVSSVSRRSRKILPTALIIVNDFNVTRALDTAAAAVRSISVRGARAGRGGRSYLVLEPRPFVNPLASGSCPRIWASELRRWLTATRDRPTDRPTDVDDETTSAPAASAADVAGTHGRTIRPPPLFI